MRTRNLQNNPLLVAMILFAGCGSGSAGMAHGFSETPSQCSLLYNFTSAASAGTETTLRDDAGKTVVSFTPGKAYFTEEV